MILFFIINKYDFNTNLRNYIRKRNTYLVTSNQVCIVVCAKVRNAEMREKFGNLNFEKKTSLIRFNTRKNN